MTPAKRKALYWTFKLLSVIISCAFPIWAIYDKFPMWMMTEGPTRTFGAGNILTLIVVVIIFRKSVFAFLSEKLNLKHAPPMVIWLVLLILSYILIYINNFIKDLTVVFFMGLVGCAIGTVLTYIAENKFGEKKE